MPFKLLVTKTDEPATQPDSFVFHQERITIGRDSTNELPLLDPQRVVSKQHAEIVQRGTTFLMTDLGSKNFTYLNGDRIQAGRPYEIHPGDAIRIGDFELRLEIISIEPEPVGIGPPDFDRTVFDVRFVNPFQDDVKLLADALRSISMHYRQEAPNRRDDALREAMSMEIDVQSGDEVLAAVARQLSGGATPPPAPAFAPAAPPQAVPPAGLPPHQTMATQPVSPPPSRPSTASALRDALLQAGAPRLHRLVDTVLRSVARLISAPWNFRHEFIGQTIMQSDEMAFLYEGDVEVLKRRLLDPAVPEEEADARLRLLENAIDDVALHQVAMLDGYKAAVQEGGQRLLDQISPDAIEAAVTQEKPLYRVSSSLAKAEALDRLKQQLQELRSEDWSAGERRTYRPAFIKAYLARMTSSR